MKFSQEEIVSLEKRTANVAKSRTFNNLIKEYDLGNKKVLDIGCSYGEFLAKFGKDSLGITVSQKEVDWGEYKGLNIKIGNVEEDFDTEEKFDAIFANNIFEHMLAPHLFLLKIKKYLKEDGILILGVPCVPYIQPLVYLRQFAGSLSPAHVNFFNRYTLQLSVAYGGWKVSKNSGFYFTNKILDYLFNFICPHFYVTAKVDKDFKYDGKRLLELVGYSKMINIK